VATPLTNDEKLDKNYILGKLLEILEDDLVSSRDKLQAIKLAGEYRKLFGERRVGIDIRSIITQLSSNELKGLTNGEPKRLEGLTVDIVPESSDRLD